MTSEKTAHRLGLSYALFCYAAVNAALVYMILFVNDLFIPGVSRDPTSNWGIAMFVNITLIVLWGLQHSVMARRKFKEVWTRIIPPYTERATYCLASAVALAGVCFFWVPMTSVAWDVEPTSLRWLLVLGGMSGWVLLLAATFEIDHFELFGVKQAWAVLQGRELQPHAFQARYIYAWVRHPIQTGFLLGMWLTPTMSASRLTFSAMMTVYIFVGLYFEERDLIRHFGQRYLRYMREVPRLFPVPVPNLPENGTSLDDAAEVPRRS